MSEEKQIKADPSGDAGKALFEVIVSQLYERPAVCSVREILSNAVDANHEVGNEEKGVDIDYQANRRLVTIRDYGPGLDPDRMENLYGSAFASTKRGAADQIGSYGIGRLSVLAHHKEFYLHTFVDGRYWKYRVFLNKDHIPSYELVEGPLETDEENGTAVFIPRIQGDSNDLAEIKNMLVKQALHSSVPYRFSGDFELLDSVVEEERDEKLLEGNEWVFFKNKHRSGIAVYVNGVYYRPDLEKIVDNTNIREARDNDYSTSNFTPLIPIDFQGFTLRLRKDRTSYYDDSFRVGVEELALFLDASEVDLTSSREGIKLTEKSMEAINEKYLNFCIDFVQQVQEYKESRYIIDNVSGDLLKRLMNLEICEYKGLKLVDEVEHMKVDKIVETDEGTNRRKSLVPGEKLGENETLKYEYNDYASYGKLPLNYKFGLLRPHVYLTPRDDLDFGPFKNLAEVTEKDNENLTNGINITPKREGSRDSFMPLSTLDATEYRVVVLKRNSGITPLKFCRKNGIPTDDKPCLLFRFDYDIDLNELTKPLQNLRNYGIVDLVVLNDELKSSKPKESTGKSKSRTLNPETKTFRREIVKIKTRSEVDQEIDQNRGNRRILSSVDKWSRCFHNGTDDGGVDLSSIEQEAYYVLKEDNDPPVDFLYAYANNSLFQEQEPLYVVKDQEHLEKLKEVTPNTTWRTLEKLILYRQDEYLEKLISHYGVLDPTRRKFVKHVISSIPFYEIERSRNIFKYVSKDDALRKSNYEFLINMVGTFKDVADKYGLSYEQETVDALVSFNRDVTVVGSGLETDRSKAHVVGQDTIAEFSRLFSFVENNHLECQQLAESYPLSYFRKERNYYFEELVKLLFDEEVITRTRAVLDFIYSTEGRYWAFLKVFMEEVKMIVDEYV